MLVARASGLGAQGSQWWCLQSLKLFLCSWLWAVVVSLTVESYMLWGVDLEAVTVAAGLVSVVGAVVSMGMV